MDHAPAVPVDEGDTAGATDVDVPGPCEIGVFGLVVVPGVTGAVVWVVAAVVVVVPVAVLEVPVPVVVVRQLVSADQ